MYTITLRFLTLFSLFVLSVGFPQAQAAPSIFDDGIIINDTALSTGLLLDVGGRIGATEFCAADGTGCVLASDLGGGLWNAGAGANEINYTAGNVGVGVADPSRTLDVGGSGVLIDHISTTYDLWVQGGTASSGDDRNLAILGIDEDSGDYLFINHAGEYAGGTRFGGNVAIGSNFSPTEELVVRRDQATGTISRVHNAGAGTGTDSRAAFVAASNGNQLDISTYSVGATGTLAGQNRADGAFIRATSGASPAQMSIGTGAAVPLNFFTADATRMTIDGAGNVGIGTTGPSDMLTMNGAAPNIRLIDTTTGADAYIEADSSSGSLSIQADANNEVADSNVIFTVDGAVAARFNSDGDLVMGDGNSLRVDDLNDIRAASDMVVRCDTGQVMVGFDTNGIICEDPVINYD